MVSAAVASNMKVDAFTSGGCTVRPIVRASSRKPTTLSVLSMSLDSTAAMNSDGWWAFNHAVWYDTSA